MNATRCRTKRKPVSRWRPVHRRYHLPDAAGFMAQLSARYGTVWTHGARSVLGTLLTYGFVDSAVAEALGEALEGKRPKA